jgi:glycosyltransferase involved in cell wall biosynthesis
LQAHGSIDTYFQKGLEKRAYDLLIGNRLLKDAHKVIAVSEVEVPQYVDKHILKSNITLVPNGIDLEQYNHLPERGLFRKKWGISPNTKLILYLGRIHWMKGIDILIRSFNRLSGDVKLVIVGSDGHYLRECKEMVASLHLNDRVIFTGGLYDADKFEALVDSDLFVLLSTYEIFSISILEASACGLPVLAAKNCGNISSMPSVYPVCRNAVSVSRSIDKILSDTSIYNQMSEQGIKIARQFNWDMIAGKLEEAYGFR